MAASKVLVILINTDDGKINCSLAMDLDKVGLDLCHNLQDSSPSDRKELRVPGCSVKNGYFVTNLDRDALAALDLNPGDDVHPMRAAFLHDMRHSFLDLVWDLVPDPIEFSSTHHCIVCTADMDE